MCEAVLIITGIATAICSYCAFKTESNLHEARRIIEGEANRKSNPDELLARGIRPFPKSFGPTDYRR